MGRMVFPGLTSTISINVQFIKYSPCNCVSLSSTSPSASEHRIYAYPKRCCLDFA